MEEKQIITGSHKFTINNRNQAVLTGIKDVQSFDADIICLDTIKGLLTIKGEGLHVSRLTLEKGEVDIDGLIDSVEYSDNTGTGRRAGSILGRLFK